MEKEELITGAIYEVSALSFSVAMWTGETFRGPTREYGKIYFVEEQGYWEGLPFGTVRPIRRLGELTVLRPYDGVNLLAALEALNDVILEKESGLI